MSMYAPGVSNRDIDAVGIPICPMCQQEVEPMDAIEISDDFYHPLCAESMRD